MQKGDVARYISNRYKGIVPVDAWGEQSFFYNPGCQLPRGVYFATLKDKDGDNDKSSALFRDGIYRFNVGIGKTAYQQVFGKTPARPRAGGVVDTGHDFKRSNALLPHPVYGWMSWVCVLNPGEQVFTSLLPMLDEAYKLALRKFEKRVKP